MNLENYSGMRSCLPHLESQILPTPSNTLEYNFSNSKTTLKVIIQPRHANFATCGLYVVWNPGETLEGRAIINWSQELFELPISTVPLVIYSFLVLHLGANTSETSADLTSLIFSYLNKAFHRWPNWSLISLSSTPALSKLEAQVTLRQTTITVHFFVTTNFPTTCEKFVNISIFFYSWGAIETLFK